MVHVVIIAADVLFTLAAAEAGIATFILTAAAASKAVT